MSVQRQHLAPVDAPVAAPLGRFERWLSLWVAPCIATGIALVALMPGAFAALARAEYASVNLMVAVLIWVMI